MLGRIALLLTVFLNGFNLSAIQASGDLIPEKNEHSGSERNIFTPDNKRIRSILNSYHSDNDILSAFQSGNAAQIIQHGSENSSQIIQQGFSNRAYSEQFGARNKAKTNQTGISNYTDQYQSGIGNTVISIQHGKNNQLRQIQHGHGLNSRITQFGNNSRILIKQGL